MVRRLRLVEVTSLLAKHVCIVYRRSIGKANVSIWRTGEIEDGDGEGMTDRLLCMLGAVRYIAISIIYLVLLCLATYKAS